MRARESCARAKLKVGLIQVDGKTMPNLALMKLAAWHRAKGDDVTVIDISTHRFDVMYGSKIFMGGSGYDLHSELPADIEVLTPDYELFKTDHSIGFTSRGCIRTCDFCIVAEKEGAIRECPFDWISHHKVILFDNNFLASPLWKEKLEYFIRQKLKVCFTQGLDIRLVNEENATLLAKVHYTDRKFRRRRLYFSFDDPALEPVVREKVAVLNTAGIPSHHLMFYVLVGHGSTLEQDLRRVAVLKELGCDPYIMIWNDIKTPVLRRLDRWVNGHERYYKFVSWEDFDPRKTHGKVTKNG